MSNAPAKKLRIGYVTATVWKNQNGDGKPFYTVEVSRTYKDSDGNLKNTASLGHDDLLNASRVLTRAEAWIAEQ